MLLGMIGRGLGGAVLLAFYLYLAVRPQCVKRPALYRFGLVGFVVTFVGYLWTGNPMEPGTMWTGVLIVGIGQLIALFAGVMACTDVFLPAVDEYFTRRAADIRAEQKSQKQDRSH
jgi:apolipoprotein N-acyltransferase